MPRYAQILTATTVFVAPGLIAQSSSLNLGPRLISNTVSNPAPKASPPQIMQVMSGLPLVFEPNLGQTGAQAHYITRASGMTSFLTDRGNVMVLSRRRDATDPPDPHKTPEIEQSVVRMELEGSRAPQHFEGLEKVESISNYFIGNVPSKWVTNVPNYLKVRASGVYPGIDLVYYGDGRKLEYDFVVRPGANPGSIHLAYEGADSLTTDQEGNLLIATGLGTLVQRKPLVYQEINGERREVRASYSIRAGKVDFALANWDRRRALVIDPVLEYSTYLGGTGNERGNSIALDGSGMAYVTGYTSGDNFPVTAGQTTFGGGSFDAFITKLNPSATGPAGLVYSSYLGGAGSDYGYGIAVTARGVAYVTGATASTNFPTTPGVFQTTLRGGQNAFVTKLDQSGALAFSTYLGGSGTDQSNGIALDASGEAYVTGYTDSADFPTMGAPQPTIGGGRDAFVTKLNESGSALMFSTYLGGSGADQGLGIALDASGEAYVTGNTASPNFPTTGGLQMTYGGGANDAFVTKLRADGSVLYSTYLGGTGDDQGRGIAIDSNGLPYVTGQTTSTDFPTTAGAFQPTYGPGPNAAFVTKLNALGSAPPSYSTYLGPTQNGIYTQGIAIAVNASGEAYVTGQTNATNFPATSDAPQTTFGGGYDVFVTKLNASGSTLEFSTYLGGDGTDQGFGIALDSSGVAYVTGFTDSLNFPVTQPGAYQPAVGGSSDAFVAKLNIPVLGPPAEITVTGGGTQSTTVGTAFPDPLQAKVTDAGGNGLPGVMVTFAAPSSGASATLSATSVTTDSSGIASVTATANTTPGVYAVTASVARGVNPAMFNLTNLAGQAQTIVFVQRPTDTQAGQTINPPVMVKLTDAQNNPIANATVTMSLEETGATLGGTLRQPTNASGIATFADLEIKKAGTYHLVAAAGVTAMSTPFNITAGSAISITAVSGGGQTAGAGSAYGAPLKAQVEDAFMNPIQGASVTFAAPSSGASVSFTGSATVTTDASGTATSPTMTANGTPGMFQVTASTRSAPTPAVFNLTNVAGTANKLAFVTQPPASTTAGATFPVTVQVEDSFGNRVGTQGINVTLQLNTGSLSGNVSAPTDPTGVATFSNLSVTKAGAGYQLTALASGVVSALSTPFTITAAAAAKIQATGGTPQTATIGTQFAQPLQATVTDQFGNPVSGVTLTFTPRPGGSGATAAPTAPSPTDSNGHASVTATANSVAGGHTVTATAPGVPAAFTASFALTNVAGAVGRITFEQQPSNTLAGEPITPPVIVKVVDGANAPVSGAMVTLSLQGSSIPLNGTLTVNTDSTGHASFNNLSVNTVGPYQLLAVSAGMSQVSVLFTISANPTSSALISVYAGDGQSAPVGVPYSAPLKAQVQDLYGNILSGVAVNFTAPSSGASVTFSGPATVNTDANGIATSPTMTANSQTGMFQVTATTVGASSSALFTLTNDPSTASRLSFVQQPSDTIAGQNITPPVTVQLQDSSGNAVHTPGVLITVQANAALQRTHRFSGTTTQPTNANGLATFPDLSIALAGTYQLQANAPGVASATSNPFHVTTGAASSITASGGAQQGAFVLTAFSAPLQVAVTDAAGNPVAGVPVVFAAPSSGPSGTFGGQPTVTANTDAQGHAQAVITANNIAGSHVVTATSTQVTGSASFSLTNLPLSPTTLRFVQQPSNTQAGQVIAPPVTVQIQTAGGASNTAGVPIVLSLSSGTGTLLGTIVQLTDPTGTATFNDLRISTVGPKQLTATSLSQPPAASSTFQITAGAPASITAVSSSTPQSTSVLAPFPSLLQAQVLDIAGNPAPGVSVTFTAPASGPSATFAATPTVVTDNSGFATAPPLTANGSAGSFAVTASAVGVSGQAAFSLTNLPQSGSLRVNPSTLSFASQINQAAPPGQTVQVSSAGAALSWTATPSAPWITVSPSTGNTPATATISVNPAGLAAGNYSGAVVFSSASGGTTAVLVTYAIAAKPALVITPPELVFTTSNATVTPPPQALMIASSGGPISFSVTTQVATPTGGSWLKVSTSSGQTGGSVQVTVDLTGLSQGSYNGSVSFTPADSTISSVSVPVALLVACGQGGCTGFPATILSVVNGASFHPTGAPGAAMTIFGTNLADADYQATTYPLPTQLGPTSVTVNGNPVPLFFASPTQIDFQMPFGAPVGGVQVAVTNGSTRVQTAPSFNVNLSEVAPGLFINPGNRAAALNQDFSVNTPSNPVAAGAYILLFMTGHGPLSPPLAEGIAAPTLPLSLITGTVQVSIGGQSAQVIYQGVAPGFAGLAQINAIVPAGLAAGDQPVFITVNGVPSNAGLITVK